MKQINLIGEVNEAMVEKLYEAIDAAGNKDVTIELTSGGGNSMDALAIYSRLRNYPGTVTIVARGLVGSAAVLILMAGDIRLMCEHAWLFMHEEEAELSGSVSSLRHSVEQTEKEENQFNKILAMRTKVDLFWFENFAEDNAYLTSKQALEHKLITQILKEH